MKNYYVSFVFILLSISILAQVEKSSELYKTLRVNDSLIFDASFNTCNLKLLDKLIHENLEFYHDKAGVINGKKEFLKNTENGLCKSPYKLKRELLVETMQVFPMHNNEGQLYGAIQKGTHQFYQDDKKTGMAYFTHLWVLENKIWLLKRVLSYNHKAFK